MQILPFMAMVQRTDEVIRPTIRLVIVDDSIRVLRRLAEYFSLARDIVVVGTAQDALEALTLVAANDVDVVLTDIHMSPMSGLELIDRLIVLHPKVSILAMTALDTDRTMLRALEKGAVGYIVKSSSPANIIGAVYAARSNQAALSKDCLDRLVASTSSAEPGPQVDALPHFYSTEMSEDDRIIVFHLCNGLSNAEIAAQTCFSESTIKKKVSRLIKRFDCRSRLELVVHFLR